jgi:hypothetical protein
LLNKNISPFSWRLKLWTAIQFSHTFLTEPKTEKRVDAFVYAAHERKRWGLLVKHKALSNTLSTKSTKK